MLIFTIFKMITLCFPFGEIISFLLENWKTLFLLYFFLRIYINHTNRINHFKSRGIKYMEPNMFVGNLWPRLSRKVSFFETQLDVHKYFKGERYGGYFEGNRLLLYILDPDLIKAITIKDFDHFVNRMVTPSNNKRCITRIILDLKDEEWKSVRSLITPSFSSFRLRNMYPLMQESSRKLLSYLEKLDCSEVEAKELMGYFTLDVIGACAFGIDSSFNDKDNSDFIKAAKNFNALSSIKGTMIKIALLLSPALLKYFNASVMNQEAIDVLVAILKKAKSERRSSKIERNDFLQLLINAAEKESEEKSGSIELDDDTIDAQALIFLLAGYETSSTLLSFALYVLATRPELQARLRDHVRSVTGGHDVTYDHLADLDYLEGVLLETCRIYPPFARFDRVCVKPYTIPGTNIQVEVDDVVSFPVPGFHMDPNLFPDPEEFIPERFTRDEKKSRPGHYFLGFGAGPRNCIGMRFSMVSMKLAMCVLLNNYKFSVCSKTDVPLEFNKRSFVLKSVNGIWVQMDKI